MKHKFEVLDALRGFCALIVFVLHFSENYIPTHGLRLIPHGCLPVEFFFILTGFMFVYAYDGRWAQGMTVGNYFTRRILRLHPLVIIGSVIGAGCYFLAPEQYVRQIPGGATLGLGQLGLLLLWCCTLIPQPNLFGWNLLHTLQGPLWTMFYIYLANVLYAVVLRHLKTWIIAVLAVLSVGLVYYSGFVHGGFHAGACWSWWWGGAEWRGWLPLLQGTNVGALSRMFFPLFAGMLIARKGWRINTGRWGLLLCLAVLSFIFFAPEMRPVAVKCGLYDQLGLMSALGLSASKTLNGCFEATAVVIGMPLVLMLGIGGEIRSERLATVCRFLGKFSFPLYCTHYSMTILQRVWRDAHPDAPWQMHFVSVCVFAMFALFNAYGAMKLADWSVKKCTK